MRVVVGLGNPGERYRRTRHNVGFMVADELLTRAAGRWTGDVLCSWGEVRLAGQEVLLVKPMTFMNRSGEAVAHVLERHGLGPAALIVVLDDVALELGTLRLRERGSHGGHNGLRSLIDHLGTDEVARVRLGIRQGELREDLAGYVLSDFAPDQVLVVQESVGAAADAIVLALEHGLASAMNRFNAPRRVAG